MVDSLSRPESRLVMSEKWRDLRAVAVCFCRFVKGRSGDGECGHIKMPDPAKANINGSWDERSVGLQDTISPCILSQMVFPARTISWTSCGRIGTITRILPFLLADSAMLWLRL